MSQLTVVYSPDGDFFEVAKHLASELVLNKGWTQSAPIIVARDVKEDTVRINLDSKRVKTSLKAAKPKSTKSSIY